MLRIPAVVMRGGTSRGLFFHAASLPPPGELRDSVLLCALGSPDPYRRQIDGLGGATSSTSKVVIVSPSARPDSDVDYLFGQVSIDRPLVDYSGSCGNLVSAVAPFAIEEGLVRGNGECTTVRIWQVNSGRRIVAHCATRDGLPVTDGDFAMAGVPRTGAEIRVEFLEPGATACGALLPTGRPVDRLDVAGLGEVPATLVDAGIPLVIVDAADLALRGTELPEALDADAAVLARLESIRAHAAVRMGLAATSEDASRLRPASPKLAMVASPAGYASNAGEPIGTADLDLLVRALSMGRPHHALPVTVAIAIAAATAVPGTLTHARLGAGARRTAALRIGHPAGVMRVEAAVRQEGGSWVAERVVIGRTARRLMEGFVRIPATLVPGWSTTPAA